MSWTPDTSVRDHVPTDRHCWSTARLFGVTATDTGAGTAPAVAPERSRRGRRWRWVGVLPIAVALVVLLLAEVVVRVGRSQLTEPTAWPTPELQNKFGQIGARAAAGRRPDVVLVGDSMMDAGGDPAALGRAVPGVSVYNAAIAGETLPVVADWTTRIVMPRLRPKVVVVGFSSNELNPRALDPETGVRAYRSSRAVRAAEGTGSVVDRADALLRERSMLYRYRSSLRRPFTQGDVDPNVFDPELTPDGQDLAFAGLGYLQKGGPAQAQAVMKGVIAALQGFVVGLENVTILQEMIREVRRQGARVLLVAMPVTGDLIRAHPRGEADYQAAMAAFAGAADRSGATFVQPGVWPKALFADPVHVNAAGAARLTTYLAPLVEQEVAKARFVEP